MTYGGNTYGGAAAGSTSAADDEWVAVARAQSTTTAATTTVADATTTARAQSTTTATTVADATNSATSTASAQTASSTATSASAATATASAQTTATTVATDATLFEPAVEFRVTRDGTEVEDSVFDVDPVVDTANPFGDFAVIKMDDRGGEKFENYERGTRVDVAVSENFGITYDNYFTGYVVERRETEQSGADVLEVEAYSFDQFIRRNNVTNDQTGNLISEALQDIIETDTPVSYNAAKIDVGSEQELTRSYRGDPVEAVFRDLAFKSNNEEFGVDGDLDAFFRPRETEHIDRGINDSQWFNYDIPELGKEAVNEVEVWFDDGDESVIVDDGTDKLDLQESLGLPEPGTQRAELNRPLITDINDAEDIGRKYLTFRNATLSGTVTTYGLFDAEPGDTIDVTIEPRGIDEEFVIAATEDRWGRDEKILTIVENRGEVDDILAELNDSVQRQEMEGADRDAPKNRITTTNATAIVDVDVTADVAGGGSVSADAVRFVNDGRRAVRDAWAGDTPPDIDTLVIGTDGGGLSRSNTELRNQTNSVSVSQSLPDATSVQFDGSATDDGIEELGIESADGRLIARATFDSAVDLQGTVEVTLSVRNDDSVSRGVLTTAGQTAVRDALADTSPSTPTDYAYGSGDRPVAESDTALESELVESSLENILIQNASNDTGWQRITPDFADDKPMAVSGGSLTTLQTCLVRETNDINDRQVSTVIADSTASDGDGVNLEVDGNYVEMDWDPDYTVPSGEMEAAFRLRFPDDPDGDGLFETPEIALFIDGELRGGFADGAEISTGSWFWQTADAPNADRDSVTVRIECEGNSEDVDCWVDLIAVYDRRYHDFSTFDNSVDANGFLSSPNLFPELVETSFATASTRRDVTEANFDLSAPDVGGSFYVELANDGSTFTRFDNQSSGSVTFGSADADVDTNVGLGRYGSRTDATPTEGYLAQHIDAWELFANPDAVTTDDIGTTITRAVVPPNTSGIVGETVRESGIKSDGDLLTRHILAEFDLLADQRLASSELTTVTGGD